MIRTIVRYARVGVASIFLIVLGACGSGSSHSNSLSPAQAQAVSQEMMAALQAALNASITTGLSARRVRENFAETFLERITQDRSGFDLSPNTSSGCVTSVNGTSCNIPVSYSGSCPQGGTISISGDFSFTLDNSGDGSDSTTLTITPTNCSASSNTATVTFNGDPNIMVATQVKFQNDQPVYPITLTESGGISFGPNPSGSCSVNATLTINSQLSCTISGSICGQTVSGNCMPPAAALKE